MSEGFNEVKSEIKAKLDFWNKIESKTVKVFLVLACLGLIGLKVFTTVLTFDWLAHLI